jgi:signal transduction histidine kinase
LEAGYLKLEPTRFALTPAIETVVALLNERIKQKSLTLEVHIAEGITTLQADETRIRQVLFNLLGNAIKFAKPSGKVAIHVARAENKRLEIRVHDDGPAIEPERQAKLFDPFFHGRLKQGAAAALGLSLVKRFIELHGGDIRVDSIEEFGTTIICSLPE